MKRFLLALGLVLLWTAGASAQCIGVGSVVNVPQPGISCAQDSIVPTYAATGIGIVPGATPTDIACLTGSATRVVRPKRVVIGGTAGTAINIVVQLRKNAAADSGGTPATSLQLPVPYPLDSSFPTVTATATSWTANPTINDATPGVIGAKTLFLPATGTAVGANLVEWLWVGQGGSPPVLRGVAQQVCLNLGGVTTPSSGLVTATFEWTEQVQ